MKGIIKQIAVLALVLLMLTGLALSAAAEEPLVQETPVPHESEVLDPINDNEAINEDPAITEEQADIEFYALSFTVVPREALVEIVDSEGGLILGEGAYQLAAGEYTYTVSAGGFETVEGSFSVFEDTEIDIVLEAKATPAAELLLSPVMALGSMFFSADPPLEDDDGWYQLSTPEDMLWFAAQVNAGNAAVKGKLLNNINLYEVVWMPIGMPSAAFTGQFDGGGFTIDLKITGSNDNCGLFGYAGAGAVIRNVTVAGSVSGGNYVGGVVGTVNGATIENCVNKATVSGSAPVGGIAGYLSLSSNGELVNCLNTGAVTGSYYVGGIAGQATSTWVINRCGNSGTITSTVNSSANYRGTGGIVGGGAVMYIDQCYNTGEIDGKTMHVGGIAGYLHNPDTESGAKVSSIRNSYNQGTVNYSGSYNGSQVGGIVGRITAGNAPIENCYNSGIIGGDSNYIGGVIGFAGDSANITNNFYLEGTADKGISYPTDASGKVTQVDAEELAGMAESLGEAYKAGDPYPIFTWQEGEVEPEPVSYLITVSNPPNATITSPTNGTKVAAGQPVVLSIELNSGYSVRSWIVTRSTGESVPVITEPNTPPYFTMPEAAVTVTATLNPPAPVSRTITITNPTGGTITATINDLVVTSATANTVVNLSIELNSGYSVRAWSVTYGEGQSVEVKTLTGTTASFTMPDANVTVTATLNGPGGGTSTGDRDTSTGGTRTVTPPTTEIVTPEVPLGSGVFTDVPESHWAYQYIMYLAQRGFVKGKTATLFAPSDPITRAEFVTILARMSGEELPKAYSGPFTDVVAGSFYEQAVAWAVQAGVTTGTSGTTFSPNNLITRQEIAAMIVRYAAFQKFDFLQEKDAILFTDSAQIHAYAKEPISVMQRADVINGYEDGSFRPLNNATRAEAAKMLALIHQLMN